MLSSKVCFSNGLLSDEKTICETGKDLVQCKNFYILMERFCNKISKEDVQFDMFLNKYFNDEGYVDVWRIPHLMLDIYNCNFEFRSNILDNFEFKGYFIRFLGLFHNYCLTEFKPYLIDELILKDEKRTVLQIKANQHLMNVVMDTYSRIIENLEAYKREE
jgi:hypothetical protein